MIIYGVAVLAACYIIGQTIGELLGSMLGIDANVGGVGFAMVLLILVTQQMNQKKMLNAEFEKGILFWSNIYIPVIVAMSASQNVIAALSGGWIALLAGVVPVVICFALIPLFSRFSNKEPSA